MASVLFYLRLVSCYNTNKKTAKGTKVLKHLEVVAAIIKYNDLILCMQRPVGKFDYVSLKFEFPGGKVEPGETNSQALMRELSEEMAMKTDITEDDYFMTVTHQYPAFEITMHSFICPVESQEFVRKEHVDHKWLPVEELNTLDWAPADQPIVNALMNQ